MNIEQDKIKALIEAHGKSKGYEEKSYTVRFCEDFNLNYVQWGSYARGTQKAGIKIIYHLMSFFPKLNLNWLLKDDPNMFLETNLVSEPEELYTKTTEERIYSKKDLLNKLELIDMKITEAKAEVLKALDEI